jgi:ribosome-binding factor A
MVYRYTKAPTQRQLRVSEVIKQTIAGMLLRGELTHLEMSQMMVSIADVKISADLKIATVFVAVMPSEREKEVIVYLNEEVGFIRKHLSRVLQLRAVPNIRFVYDASFAEGAKVDELLEMTKKS